MNPVLTNNRARMVGALDQFLKDLVNDRSFDYVIPVERKGTALVRAALSPDEHDNWSRILSSNAIETIEDPNRRVRVLVLDDSVWSGQSLTQTVFKVSRALPNAEIVKAAFATHLQAPVNLVDIAYYRAVDDFCYRDCRDALVEYLQAKGSLLLDTEHLEISAEVLGDTSDFYAALAGWAGLGKAVLFASANRVNCTVFRPAETLTDVFKPVCPPFAELESAICKIRVVSHPTKRQTYSLIPICYPELRLNPGSRFESRYMPWTKLISWDPANPNSRLFQCVGLAFSVELALDLMTYLEDALPERVAFNFDGDGIDHLLSIFPEMDVMQVRSRLEQINSRRRSRKTKSGVVDDPGLEILESLSEEILARCYDRYAYDTGYVKKLSVDDILQVSRLVGQSEPRVSAALDILIDSARILPELAYDKIGDATIVKRIFGPEGEIVKRKLVRSALGRGRGLERAIG